MGTYRHTSMRSLVREDQDSGFRLLKRYLIECRPSFPDPNEIGSYEEFQLLLTLNDSFDIHILFDEDVIIAGAHIQILSVSRGDVAVTEHLWVRQEYRRQGIGGGMNAQLLNALWAAGVLFQFQEINDPHIMNEDERALDISCGITPEERITFWKEQGYQALDVSYSQPRLSGAEAPVTYCLIAVNAPTTMQLLETDFYIELLHEYFLTFLSDVDDDPTFAMIQEDTKKLAYIPLIPLDKKRKNLGKVYKDYRKKVVKTQKERKNRS